MKLSAKIFLTFMSFIFTSLAYAESSCDTDAALLVGKWDGFWSGAQIYGVFEGISVQSKDDKCILKFKLYQKRNENKSDTFNTYEIVVRPGDKVDFDRLTVERPAADIWGSIDKKSAKIVINHKRPEFSTAGFAEFKKRME